MIPLRYLLPVLMLFPMATSARTEEGQAAKEGPAEQWVCTFATTTTSQPKNAQEQTPTTEKFETIVSLAPAYFSVRSPSQTSLADISNEAFYYANAPTKQTVGTFSFSAMAQFRVKEFQHRKAGYAAMKAAGIPAADVFELETFLGVQIPPRGQAKAVEATKVGEGWEFKHQGRVVVSVASSSYDLPLSLHQSWNLFLTHMCRLHPEVRTILKKEVKLPERLQFSYLGDFSASVTEEYQLLSVRRRPASKVSDLIAGKHIVLSQNERLNKLLEKLSTMEVPTTETALNAAVAAVKVELQAGHFIDAALIAQEYFHQTGDEAGSRSMVKDMQPKVKSDPLVRKLYSLSGGSEEITELRKDERLKECQRLYLLDYLFVDSALEEGYDPERARNKLLDILEEHPLLCGALIDIGRSYHSEYNTFFADHCFQAAKKMYPKHYALKEIDDLDLQVRKDFPDFFRSETAK